MIKTLKQELIKIETESTNKNALLKEISENVTKLCTELTSDQVYKALVKREKLSSTGLTQGLAIPHCTFDSIKEFYVGVIIIKNGIDFDSLDDEPTKIVFYSIGPKDQQSQHISTLTSISKIAKDRGLVESIINSTKAEDVYSLLHIEQNNIVDKGIKCQFIIHVQEEKLFQDILEILAADVEGAVSVIDAQTAGHYLHKLPLFSSFWNDITDQFSKIIIAVIDKPLMNETVRRINMVKVEGESRLLIAVNELLYFDGSLEY